MGFLKLYSTLSRWEFLPATSVAILIGIFLGVETWETLLDLTTILVVLEGLIIFFLLFNVGFMVNCWADWEVDEVYKTNLSDAVKKVGRKTVGRMVVAHIIVSLLLTAHVSLILTFKPIIFLLVLTGTFLGVAYSVEPFRFKSKGAGHALMAFPVFACPGLFAFYLVNDLPVTVLYSLIFILLVVGITVAHYALVLLSQSEDYPDDKAMDITTPAVAWGLRTTVRRALKMNIWGNTVNVCSFTLFMYHSDPAQPYLLMFLPLLIGATYWTTYQVHNLNQRVSVARSDKAALGIIRKVMKDYTKFHGIPLGAIMLCSMILMVHRSLFIMGW